MIEIKVKMTKKLYKAIDSYERYQRWLGKQLLKIIQKKWGEK